MSGTTQTISPLHQRMIDDMRMYNLPPNPQSRYVRVMMAQGKAFPYPR